MEKITAHSKFAGTHAGAPAFVIGNGPSLRDIPMKLLKNQVTFGSNRIYLGFPEWGFETTYYAAQDSKFLSIYKLEIQDRVSKEVTKFFPSEYLGQFDGPQTHYLNMIWRDEFYPSFSKDLTRIYEGWTVSYMLLQIAYAMGCDPIYLVGMDYSYDLVPIEHDESKWFDNSSKSHFHPDYMGPSGHQWNTPKFEKTDLAFARASQVANLDGRKILNLTPGSKLHFFPQRDFYKETTKLFGGESILSLDKYDHILVVQSSVLGDNLRALNSARASADGPLLVNFGEHTADFPQGYDVFSGDHDDFLLVLKNSGLRTDQILHLAVGEEHQLSDSRLIEIRRVWRGRVFLYIKNIFTKELF